LKIAFVVGFFDPVKTALLRSCPEHLENRSVIWIRQIGVGREANLKELSGAYFDRVRPGVESVLVLLAVVRGREFVIDAVRGIIARGKESSAQTECELLVFKNAGDRNGVLDRIIAFGLQSPTALSCGAIRAKISDGRILCVSMKGRTSILDSLSRAGFTGEAIQTFFDEERIEGARNSSLMEYLDSRSRNYKYLLYAWDGLRTLKSEVKRGFEKCYEAPSASKVVDLFRRWIVEGV